MYSGCAQISELLRITSHTVPAQLSKLLNYIQWHRTKTATFTVLLVVWTYVSAVQMHIYLFPDAADNRYFRHWLNWVMLYSVWFEFDLMPYVPRATALTHDLRSHPVLPYLARVRNSGRPRTACG